MPSLTKSEIKRRNRLGIPLRENKVGIKLESLTREVIESIPKDINENGCWIPKNKNPNSNGYIQVTVNNKYLSLHRIVVCIYYNLKYEDKSFESRHNLGCDKACFNNAHLKPGTCSDNIKDSVKHKTHVESRKTKCSKCGGEYKTRIRKRYGMNYQIRYCPVCEKTRNAKRYLK